MSDSTMVNWPTLLAWCRDHGAKNDRIETIEIVPVSLAGESGVRFAVRLTGHEEWVGKPFAKHRSDAAQWQSTEPLRRLP